MELETVDCNAFTAKMNIAKGTLIVYLTVRSYNTSPFEIAPHLAERAALVFS